MKRAVQLLIRRIHVAIAKRTIPERIGIYFHALESQHWDCFGACITTLRQLGYEFVSPDELVRGGSRLSAFVSFDDNYHSWYEALPLLDSLKCQATFYVNTLPTLNGSNTEVINHYYDRVRHAGRRIALSRIELRSLREAGHTIGNHTHSHRVVQHVRNPFGKHLCS